MRTILPHRRNCRHRSRRPARPTRNFGVTSFDEGSRRRPIQGHGDDRRCALCAGERLAGRPRPHRDRRPAAIRSSFMATSIVGRLSGQGCRAGRGRASARTTSARRGSTARAALSIDRVEGLSFDLSVQGSGAAEIGDADVDQLNVNVIGTAARRSAAEAAKLTAIVARHFELDAAALARRRMRPSASTGRRRSTPMSATPSPVDAGGPATVG